MERHVRARGDPRQGRGVRTRGGRLNQIKVEVAKEVVEVPARGRGARRGRGVRTQGGSRGGIRQVEVEVAQEIVEVSAPRNLRGVRASRSLRGVRRRGSAATLRPTASDEIQILSVEDFPRGMPQERPLHVKKRRARDLLNISPAPLAVEVLEEEPAPAPPTAVPFKKRFICEPAPSPAIDAPPSFAPSPALSLECGGSSRSSPARPKRPLQEADIEMAFNYGSESDGEGDSEDEDLVPMLMSRVYVGALDTPLDEEPEVLAAPPVDVGLEPGAKSPVNEAPALALASAAEGAVEPHSFFHFQWRRFPDPPIPPRERRTPFIEQNVGPTEKNQDPYSIFVSIWDSQVMERIVVETNRYAQQYVTQRLENNTLSPKSRICFWKDTCTDELYTYFAIILAMGIVIKSKLEEYWSSDYEIFSTPGFRAYMKLHRFQLLNTCIHFNNNANMRAQELTPAEAKLFKVEPIVTHLNTKFQSMYTMSQNIALDESLLQWKGWLSINQFISNKAAKIGIKTYELCESQTGYLYKFTIHAEKHQPQNTQNPLDASTPTIVLNLLRGLEGKGYTVWMDNFYNSPALARQLKVLGFDVVGTLRTNRQFVPQELTDLNKSNMRKGQITGFTSGDVDLMVWLDENRVATISTYHGNETGVSDGKVKPSVILDYNVMMGGVDKKDQLLSMYPIERKRTKIWYKKFFRRLLNVSVLNSFIIAKQSGCRFEKRNFRKNLIQSLLSRHSTPIKIPLPVEESAFYAKTHYLMEYGIGANKSRLRRKCCVCKKLTRFYCAGCEKTVCISTCFVSLHS